MIALHCGPPAGAVINTGGRRPANHPHSCCYAAHHHLSQTMLLTGHTLRAAIDKVVTGSSATLTARGRGPPKLTDENIEGAKSMLARQSRHRRDPSHAPPRCLSGDAPTDTPPRAQAAISPSVCEERSIRIVPIPFERMAQVDPKRPFGIPVTISSVRMSRHCATRSLNREMHAFARFTVEGNSSILATRTTISL